MSDPIRKLGGTGGLPGAGGVPGDVSGAGGDAFRTSLEATRPTHEVTEAGAAGASSSVKELGAALQTGQIEPSAVIERLVEKALAAPEARALTDAGRAELERALRSALAHDPTLLGLQADLGRG